MAIMRRLREHYPDNSGCERDLSVSHNNIATILEVQENLSEELEYWEAGLIIMQHLAQLDSTNAQSQQNLQETCQTLEALKQRIEKTQ